MCHRPSEPSADRARTVSVARRPTAWSCCGTIKSSSAVRNQSFAGPATDAALPTRRRCPGTVGTGVPARRPEPSAHGGRCSSAAGTFNQNTQRRLLVRADVRPGGFRRYNSTIPRLLLVPLPTRLLARRSGSTAVHAFHGGPPPSASVPVGSCSWWSRAAACDDPSGFLMARDHRITRRSSC